MDSSGLFQIDKKKAFIYKKAVSGSEFIQDEKVHPFLRDSDTSTLTVAHNRAATQGTVSDDNAHPFAVPVGKTNDLLLGVHNGTLHGWDTSKNVNKREVDSHWAFDLIAKEGADAFEEISGAYAMVWYNTAEPGVLNFARNSLRPMYMLYGKDKRRMLFGSEYQMLGWLAHRNEMDVLTSEIIDLTPGRLYKFNVNKPQEFESSILPTSWDNKSSRSVYRGSAWVRTDPADEAKKYTEGFRLLLQRGIVLAGGASKEEKKDTTHKPTRATTGHGSLVTPEETRVAKACGMKGTEVKFQPDIYDEEENAIYGTIRIEGDTPDMEAGVLRRVSPADWLEFKHVGALACRVIGAYPIDKKDPIGNFVFCLSRNVKPVPMTADEAEALARGIVSKLEEFQTSNATAASILH